METNVIEAPRDTKQEENGKVTEKITDSSQIKKKMRLQGTVTKVTLGGAIVDLGLDKPGFVHLTRVKPDPIKRVENVLDVGQIVEVWVLRPNQNKDYIELTMIEPFEREWNEIKKGMVVQGKVTRIENFGAFVEIGAERPGLIHISEFSHDYIKNPHEVVSVGDQVEVKVLKVNKRKKQIKLSRKALFDQPNDEKEDAEVTEEIPISSEPAPTAMEAALREAMERSKKETPEKNKSKADSPKNAELEDILSRTLKNQPKN